MSKKVLRIIPLGGLGEVGKNMMVFEYGKNILIVDSGLMFPENDMWGIDYIIPDLTYLDASSKSSILIQFSQLPIKPIHGFDVFILYFSKIFESELFVNSSKKTPFPTNNAFGL